jgi:hypothetical protein
VNEFGETLRRLMEKRGLRGPEDLARRLEEAGHPVPARDVRECMEGARWVDEHLPWRVARVLGLDLEEMGALARTVAYCQIRPGEVLSVDRR